METWEEYKLNPVNYIVKEFTTKLAQEFKVFNLEQNIKNSKCIIYLTKFDNQMVKAYWNKEKGTINELLTNNMYGH